MRRTVFLLVLLGGLVLAGAGFFLAAPVFPTWTEADSNPRVPFAAGMFALGIIVIFLAAAVYEVLPDAGSEDRRPS